MTPFFCNMGIEEPNFGSHEVNTWRPLFINADPLRFGSVMFSLGELFLVFFGILCIKCFGYTCYILYCGELSMLLCY